MGHCVTTNSVFLPPVKAAKELEPILITGPPSYNPRVKIHDWHLRSHDQTRGKKIRNLRRSTYKRLGADDEPTGISVTRASTEQIYTKSEYERDQRSRSLLNFYSFPLTETNEHKAALVLTDLEYRKPIEPTDYRTTLRDDFPPHFEIPPPCDRASPVPDMPWLLYRRILGYNNYDLERRGGINKFLDDNMNIQNRAAACKMSRFVSYDPMRRRYTDTKKYSDALLKICADK